VEGVDDLPAAIVSALRAPEAARDQAERGRQEVLRRYDWEHLAARLEEVWMDCARPPATRHGDRVLPTFRSAAA
jgi:hypothetical protein